MRVLLVAPPLEGAVSGNRVTAERWEWIFRQLGHETGIARVYDGQPCDLLVALHAIKSAPSVLRFRQERGVAPLVVALTGTDIYGEGDSNERSRPSIELADRLVTLQPRAIEQLPSSVRAKARTIVQSAERVVREDGPGPDRFEVAIVGHLRAVKDPFRAAEAARLLPADSRVHVLQVGGALEPGMAERARAEAAANPRYSWLGTLEHAQALQVLVRSRLLALTSRSEGGANVVSEALANGVPVATTRIPGSLGLLGADHPATFDVGDTAALAALLRRAETDAGWYSDLKATSDRLAPLVAPERERAAWALLLEELTGGVPAGSALDG